MISTDTLEDNTAFARKENADFPILADPTKQTATRYGVLRQIPSFGSVPNRWTFYIGKDGDILEIDKAVRPATAGEDVVATLQRLNIARKK